MSSLLKKLLGAKDGTISKLEKVSTEFGSGFRQTIVDEETGAERKCTLIQDAATGEWKSLGDPRVCQILRRHLEDVSSPLTGPTSTEKVREAEGLT